MNVLRQISPLFLGGLVLLVSPGCSDEAPSGGGEILGSPETGAATPGADPGLETGGEVGGGETGVETGGLPDIGGGEVGGEDDVVQDLDATGSESETGGEEVGAEDIVSPPPPDGVDPLNVSIETGTSILSGTVEIIANVTGGDDVKGVEFTVDTTKLYTDLIPPYSVYIDTVAFGDGDHVITVESADGHGQVATDSVGVIFDNTAPIFQSTSPADCATVFFEDGPFQVEANVADPRGIASVTFRANGLLLGEVNTPPYAVEADYADLFIFEESLPQNVLVQVTAVDTQGQETEISQDVEVHRRFSWLQETLGEVHVSPVLVGNTVVFINQLGEIWGMSPEGGHQWTANYPGYAFYSPTQDPSSNQFFFCSQDNGFPVYGVSEGGSFNWASSLGDAPCAGSPAVASDRVYFISFEGNVHAFDKNSGSLVWNFPISDCAFDNVDASPAATPEGRVYAGCLNFNLYAVEQDPGNPSSGVLKWTFPTGGQIQSTPVVDSTGVVYFGSDDGFMYAVTPFTTEEGIEKGIQKWSVDLQDGPIESRALVDEENNAIYVAGSFNVHKLSLDTGDVIWAQKTQLMTRNSPVFGPDGVVYISIDNDQGGIWALAPETGEVLFQWQLGDNVGRSPVVVGDRLFFGSHDRNLYSIHTATADLFTGICEEVPEGE